MTTIKNRLLRFACSCFMVLVAAGCMGSSDDAGALIEPSVRLTQVTVTNSGWRGGRVSLPIGGNFEGEAYVNVVVDLNGDGRWAAYTLPNDDVQAEWVVRNVPTSVVAGTFLHFSFALPDAGLADRRNLALRAVITTAPIAGAAWDGTGPASVVAARDMTIDAVEARNVTIAPGFVGGGLRSDMPDFKQPKGSMECVPLATAASLRWLALRNPEAFKNLPDDAKMIQELREDLGFDPATGVPVEKIQAGKDKFIHTRHSLPVSSEQVAKDFDKEAFAKIKAEFDKGRDVEIVVNVTVQEGSTRIFQRQHMVTVVDVRVNEAGEQFLHVKDPLEPVTEANKEDIFIHKVQRDPFDASRTYLPDWELGGSIEAVFADSFAPAGTVTTPSTPGATTSTTPTPSTPGTTTSTTPTPAPSTPGTTTSTTPTPAPSTPGTPTTTTPAPSTPGTATPTAPTAAVLKVVGETSYAVTHVRGVTACPTPVGTVSLQNVGGQPMIVRSTSPAGWLDVLGGTVGLTPGTSASLVFQFNCSNYVDGAQSTTLSINAVDSASGASAGQAGLSISLTVQ